MQRLRVMFSRGEEVKFISHLDLMRLWHRVLRRARIPLAYSQGFNPQPRLSLAAPLAVGVTSEAELLDLFCVKWVSLHHFAAAVNQQLPPGVRILKVYQVPLVLPSLQSQVRYAEYRVEVRTEKEQKDIEAAVARLLSVEHLAWEHQRDTGTRSYDLRALIDDLWVVGWGDGCCVMEMRLRSDSSGSGRPEQVVRALGFSQHPQSVHRIKLILEVK